MDSAQNIISFCSGYSGLELGLELAGVDVRTVAYVEIEAYAVANLVAKMEEGQLVPAPVWTDLKTFPSERFRGKVHGITAGYPCQPFSVAGQRKGADDPRHLWPFIREHVRAIRPLWCFFENVEGHLRLGFKEVFSDLRSMGYAVKAGLFTASEVGAPHRRKRLFILAHRHRWGCRTGNSQEQYPLQRGELFQSEFDHRNEVRSHFTSSGELVNADSGRSGQNRKQCELRSGCFRKSSSNQGFTAEEKNRQGQWPARPGQEQYEWEPPRTVEPGLGKLPDGYNPRVDQLRLLGNGVVPQTAAKAWIELLKRINQ